VAKIPLGMEVGFGPGHIMLDGHPAPPTNGHSPHFSAYLIVVKRLDGSRCTWYEGRPRPGQHCLRWEPNSPRPKGHSHICCGQMAGWIKMPLGTEVGLGPGDCFRWGPGYPPKKGAEPPNFRPMSIVVKRLDGSR